MMVAAHASAQCRVGLDHRRAAELAAPDHQRVVEQPALLEIEDQGGAGPVGLSALGLQSPGDVASGGPTPRDTG